MDKDSSAAKAEAESQTLFDSIMLEQEKLDKAGYTHVKAVNIAKIPFMQYFYDRKGYEVMWLPHIARNKNSLYTEKRFFKDLFIRPKES